MSWPLGALLISFRGIRFSGGWRGGWLLARSLRGRGVVLRDRTRRLRRLRVGLGVLFLQLLERGLLGLGALAGFLLVLLLFGGSLGLRVSGTGATLFGKRHAEGQKQLEGLLVGLGGRRDRHVQAAYLIDRVVVDFREDQLLADAHRVVATAVEGAGVEAAEVADAGHCDRAESVEELPHAGTAQRHRDTDGHPLADLERGDRLARPPHVGMLAGDRRQLFLGGFQHLVVLLGLPEAHVERDLLQPRRLHRRRVAELADQRGQDLLLVALVQAGRRGGLGLRCSRGLHQNDAPLRLENRSRLPPLSRRTPTRVGLLSLGSSSITLEMWIGPSFSTIPPICLPLVVSCEGRGRSWRLTMLRCST